MSDTRTHFSQFSAEEQRKALAHRSKVLAFMEQTKKLEKLVADARARVTAKPILEEFIQSSGLADIAERLTPALANYLQEQQAALSEAETKLRDYNEQYEREAGNTSIMAFSAVFKALNAYCTQFGAEPVVYDDIEWGEALGRGTDAFDELIQRELQETRDLLSQQKPNLLNNFELRRIGCYFDESEGVGGTFYANADKLRHFRAQLAALRAKAQE